jgi:NADPH-dependent 7-cyano-7-deazaguanine reductase QueF-like protein
VPRLVLLALEALCESRNQSFMASCSIFESKILKWYGNASQCIELHSVNELVHIIYVCACGYQLSPDNTIPNTDLVVGDLVDGGIIFHYGDNRYNTLLLTFSQERRKEILQYLKSLIGGVDLWKCFFSFDSWLNESLNLYAIGIEFELIFSHCLCIKYYLHSLTCMSLIKGVLQI